MTVASLMPSLTTARLAVVLLALLLARPIEAKCSFEPFMITISVSDRDTANALSNSSLLLFANEESDAWLPEYFNAAPLKTDTQGRFKARFYFNTSTGKRIKGRDDCSRILTMLTVVASREGYVPSRIQLSTGLLASETRVDGPTILIPTIMLSRAQRTEE